MTVEDYMKLTKKRLAELLAERDNLNKLVLPSVPVPESPAWGCDGTHCTNPHMDCINCPIKTTGGTASSSGNLTLKADWKPSEEQMEALWNTLHPDDPYYVDLSSLYVNLKKL